MSKGYHRATIPRGKYGQVSKIVEEIHEVRDAWEQGNTLMALLELSDLLGAMEGLLRRYHIEITEIFGNTDRGELLLKGPASFEELDQSLAKLERVDTPTYRYLLLFEPVLETINRFAWNYRLNLGHLYVMAQATHRAFLSGERRVRN